MTVMPNTPAISKPFPLGDFSLQDLPLEKPAIPNVIETRNVSKLYKVGDAQVRAVADVSMYVKPGEFIGLVGPSGSGKTTMLAILAALLAPTAGEVLIDGTSISQLPESERVRFRRDNIGFTFQSNNLVPYLTVLENVELMLQLKQGKLRPAGRDRARYILVRLGLESQLHSLPHQLSGGQRQRVAIARSLVHNPSVVLADEPTASLDTERAYQVVEIFANLIHEENKAGIMVTHDLRMCQFVDRVIQMVDGQVDVEITERDKIMEFISCF